MKSLPFHIPEAWKRYPFRTEPPNIGHYREYPTAGRKFKRKSKRTCKQRSHVQRKDNEGAFFSLSCAGMEPIYMCEMQRQGQMQKMIFSHFFFGVGNWACVCICVTQCSSYVYFLGFAFVNCIWGTVVNQTLNLYHVISIEDQRVIALAPFFVESANKKYKKCAMDVYLPILEDQCQNESETAVYGCHWPRDSTLRMGRSA